MAIPKVRAPMPPPRDGFNGREEVAVMDDLMIAAMQTDSTRVLSYRQPVNCMRPAKYTLPGV
jgi:hypothetical protein